VSECLLMKKSTPRKRKKPILTYRILSVPVDGQAPYSFASPKCVADLFEQKARKKGWSLEEYLVFVFDNDLKQAVVVTLDEVEKGHTLWKEEFEQTRHPGEAFRIVIDVPGVYADYVKKRLLLRGSSTGEQIMQAINRSLLAFEVQAEEPEVQGHGGSSWPQVIGLAASVTLLLASIYDNLA
jgi:hypothetical protein